MNDDLNRDMIIAEVCNDLMKREQLGRLKYGISINASNLPLKAWMQHAYEEALDFAVYLKRAMRDLQ